MAVKRGHRVVCACISLMSQKYEESGTFSPKGVLFTKAEIADEANRLFPNENAPVKEKDVRDAVEGEGGAGYEKFFVMGSDGTLSPYCRLACPHELERSTLNDVVGRLQPVVGTKIPAKFGYELAAKTRAFLVEYRDFVDALPSLIQPEDEDIAARKALWLIGAVFAYNEFHRTGAVDKASYSFKQSLVSRSARCFNQKLTPVSCNSNASYGVVRGLNKKTGYSYLVAIDGGADRRVSAPFEGDKTRPEELDLGFEVVTIIGRRTVADLIEFIEGDYARIVDGFPSDEPASAPAAPKLEELAEDPWAPPSDEYEPGLTVEEWRDLLANGDVTPRQTLIALKCFRSFGEEGATCKEVADSYGRAHGFYSVQISSFGKRVHDATGCPVNTRDNGGEQRWSIPCVGRRAKGGQDGAFVWRLRPELAEALDKVEFPDSLLFEAECFKPAEESESAIEWEKYDRGSFLDEVFMDERDYERLVRILMKKKNVILQGSPGTGKTFAAKRLAWSILGEKDGAAVEVIQFHQSTCYEDVVAGYRPAAGGGFEPRYGTFALFCKKAERTPGKPHFFIIDEINRGNVSKVFGELLMLIEADHRGEAAVLPVTGEAFCVPDNVYVIGMMNTADRGLALIDYALRRRFAFFEMEPALTHPKFVAAVEACGNAKLSALAAAVAVVNADIERDESLGKGFRIGHSYLCLDRDAATDEAISDIVELELAPLVEEYWFDDADAVSKQVERLRSAVR